MAYDYDLFTVGAGSGGVRASRVSAQLGAKVAVAEEALLGGTCVNVGCIPKKLMVLAAHYRDDFEDAHAYGWTVGERRFDWRTFIANKDAEIARLNGVYQRILEQNGVKIFSERATVLDANTVRVGDREITARHILIATGSRPRIAAGPGAELAITSNEIFHLPEQPKRVLIIGGGYIAVEFAGILHGMGTAVTQIYRGHLFLRGFDDDLREVLADEMRTREIDLRFGIDLKSIERVPGGLRVVLSDGMTLEVDQVLSAIGRVPNADGIGLEAAGVERNAKGAVAVDEYSRSSVPSIHAIGDVTDRINLTPVAIHEGMALAATLFGGRPTKPDHRGVPSAVFSHPPIGTVGWTEAEARARCKNVGIYRSRFRALKHTLTGREETVLTKLVVDGATGLVLGCHLLGADAGEIIQGFAVALKCGATKAQFDATVGIHPTTAEELVTMREPVPEEPLAEAAP